MTDLISRIEAGETGPELDRDIHCACIGEGMVIAAHNDTAWWIIDLAYKYLEIVTPVPYTTDIDAAMKAVPEGWHWDLFNTPSGSATHKHPFHAVLLGGDTPELIHGNAPTLPAAIVAASLRARMED